MKMGFLESARRGGSETSSSAVSLGKTKFDHFQRSRKFSAPAAPKFIITAERSCQLSPSPPTPFGGALLTPLPQLKTRLPLHRRVWCDMGGGAKSAAPCGHGPSDAQPGHSLALPEGAGAEWQPGLLRLTHPRTPEIFLRKKMKCIKGPQNWRSILGTQTFFGL